MITNFEELDLSKRYDYTDYLTWQFDEMVELIRGKVFRMSPAPNRLHQLVSSNLHGLIWSFLRHNPCQVFSAPFDVRLPLPKVQQTKSKIDTVVQPDLCVICDRSKLDERGCKGAPDWIIEILSNSTSSRDFNEKFDLYQSAGVKEYWIVQPFDSTIFSYQLNSDGNYLLTRQKPYVKGELIQSALFPDFSIDTTEVFLDN